MPADQTTTISLADFCVLTTGGKIEPWQRDLLDLIERTPLEHLILRVPARGRVLMPPLWPRSPRHGQ